MGANLIFGNHQLTRDKWMIWEMVLWGEFVVIIFLLLPDHSPLLLSVSSTVNFCLPDYRYTFYTHSVRSLIREREETVFITKLNKVQQVETSLSASLCLSRCLHTFYHWSYRFTNVSQIWRVSALTRGEDPYSFSGA